MVVGELIQDDPNSSLHIPVAGFFFLLKKEMLTDSCTPLRNVFWCLPSMKPNYKSSGGGRLNVYDCVALVRMS